MPTFAANLTTMFGEAPFLERFAAAAAAGFGHVEFQFPYAHPAERIAEAAAAAGVDIVLFNMPPGARDGDCGLAVDPARRGEFEAGLDAALAYAEALGAPRLHMMAGQAEPGDPWAEACFRDCLVLACARAAECGRDVVIEPINRRDMPGYFLCGFPHAVRVIRELDLPNLRLQFDIYHRQILHGDVTRGLTDLLPLVGHVQVAAVPHRGEPGTGELDDARLFRLLDALGYAGAVGCEYRPAGGTNEGLGWLRPWRPGKDAAHAGQRSGS